MMKRYSNMMLAANFFSTLFYAMSYPYIYAETIKAVPHFYISIEQLLSCIGTIVFCGLWNRFSDKLFKHYRAMLVVEILADVFLFADVIIRKDLSFYFLLNVIIFALVTRNLACGGTKMRAIANPTERDRERYDNNSNVICSISTIAGSCAAAVFPMSLTTLFILALIGNTIDNFFYLIIYDGILKASKNSPNSNIDK